MRMAPCRSRTTEHRKFHKTSGSTAARVSPKTLRPTIWSSTTNSCGRCSGKTMAFWPRQIWTMVAGGVAAIWSLQDTHLSSTLRSPQCKQRKWRDRFSSGACLGGSVRHRSFETILDNVTLHCETLSHQVTGTQRVTYQVRVIFNANFY